MHKNGFVRILAFCPIVNASVRQYGPLGRPLPSLSGFRPTLEAKFSAQSGYFDHNAENARSDFRHSQKSIHCARRNFDFYSFAGKRGPQGNSDAQIGHTLGHSRGGTQCPPTPPTANIAEWARASSAACVPSTARIEHRIRACKKPHCWGSLNQWCGRKDLNLHGVAPIWT